MKRSDRGSGHFFSFVFQQQGVYLALHGEHALHIGVHLLQQRPRCLVVHAVPQEALSLRGTGIIRARTPAAVRRWQVSRADRWVWNVAM